MESIGHLDIGPNQGLHVRDLRLLWSIQAGRQTACGFHVGQGAPQQSEQPRFKRTGMISLSSRPSPVLLSCGVPVDVAKNALRLSVGRSTTRADVDLVVQDLRQAVAKLEGSPSAQSTT